MSEFKCGYPCESRRITSRYGKRTSGDGFHDGIDFGGKVQGVYGDNIFATHDGIVRASYFSKSYGNCIIIDDLATKYTTLYAHLKTRLVEVGQTVKQDDVIGYMGNTGNSTGVHLHFEVRDRHYASSSFWHSHDGEFYSSQDPEEFMVEDVVEEECIDEAWKLNLIATYDRLVLDVEYLKKLIDALN